MYIQSHTYIYERDPSRVYLTPYFFYSKGKIIEIIEIIEISKADFNYFNYLGARNN